MSVAQLGPKSKSPLMRLDSLLEVSAEKKASGCADENINLREVSHLFVRYHNRRTELRLALELEDKIILS